MAMDQMIKRELADKMQKRPPRFEASAKNKSIFDQDEKVSYPFTKRLTRLLDKGQR